MTDPVGSLRVACVGTGTIGRAWATAFAAAGMHVSLFDAQPGAAETARTRIGEALADLETFDLVPSAGDALSRVEVSADLSAALTGADYVQESIREDVGLKRELYAAMSDVSDGNTLFGSSTSAIPGSDFMCGLAISPRCFVAHPTNPPFLVPLTEMCATTETAEGAFKAGCDFMEAAGQVPVVIRREVTGYVLNRLQAAVIAEALTLVDGGIMSPADIDKVMSSGLGLRWSFMGPFLTGHLNAPGGYADYMRRYGLSYRAILDDMGVPHRWSDAVFETVDADMPSPEGGDTSTLQAWRDRRLMALRRHQKTAEPIPERGLPS